MNDPTMLLADALSRLAEVLERIEQKLDAALPETGSKADAARLLGVSLKTLERRMPELIEGLHYWREGDKLIFDLELMRDWQRNRTNPAAHQRAIESRRQRLLSQRRRQG